MCEKIGFRTEKDANTVKNLVRKTSRKKTVPFRSYFCKACKRWHLTSKHKRKTIYERIRFTYSGGRFQDRQ